MSELRNLLLDNPVIAAIRNDDELKLVIQSSVRIVFVLYGDLITLSDICKTLHDHEKIVFIHIDRVEGLKAELAGLHFIHEQYQPYGIISTKISALKYANQLGMYTIMRLFVLDSLSLHSACKTLQSFSPDALEILPGVAPKIISYFSHLSHLPIIAGGLIETPKEATGALSAGALSISTSSMLLWD